ncbi:MAG: flagellar basal body-associated FliL family protein [Deltaproteobacteria bacterium]|nr:flagellar basal body-associated FliL family protein [Deltaproteobacteria bacterium]MBW1994650.1 flagellar basal body-associated FliL family protein [Deltaproteobacteria bacterium]
MAEEIENLERDESQEQKERKFPLKLILIVVAVVVLAGGGFVGWTMIQKESAEEVGPLEAAPQPKAAEAPEESEVGMMFQMDPFVVNLSDPGGKRYLKAKIELEFTYEPVRKELTARLPQLRDSILLHLSSKTMEEIQSVDGKIELRNALIKRINQVLKTGKIKNLFFTQFVIQ